MKLRKVLSLVMAFAMLLTACTIGTAYAYTDVAEDADAYEAVTGLSALGIITGYEDGTFAPEGKIKRSEMAAIIMRAMGVENAGQTNTIFYDVDASHWASGVIAEAFGAGIINGRTLEYDANGAVVGGTFDPEAEVTYEEATKMIVAAMGYNLKAESMVKDGVNPFPTAYNLIANQKGITDGVAKTAGGASRATVAMLMWNALPVNLMEQTAYGTEQVFNEVSNKSLLYSKQRAVIVEAKIDTLSLDPEEKMVELTSIALDDVAANNYRANIAGTTTTYIDVTKFQSIDKGACNFAGLQGFKVKVLVDVEDINNPVALAVFPASSNQVLEVNAKLFNGLNGSVIEYYKTADSTTVNKSSKVEDTVDGSDTDPATGITLEEMNVYVNLMKVDYDDYDVITGDTNNNGVQDSGETSFAKTEATTAMVVNAVANTTANPGNILLRFVDTDNNGYYDTLFVDNVASFVVGKVNADEYNILGNNSSTSIYNSSKRFDAMVADPYYDYDLTLDPEDGTVAWLMVDEEGNELEVSDVNVGDVITYAMSTDGTNYYYDIVVVKAASVTGTVDSVRTRKNRVTGASVYSYVIDGNEYQLNTVELASGSSTLKAGESGTFQITADGKIISCVLDATARNFGAVIGVSNATGSTFSKDVQVMVMKADGSVETLSFADDVTMQASTIDNGASSPAAVKYSEADIFAGSNGAKTAAQIQTAVVTDGRVVMYELNSKGEVKALYSAAGITTKDADYKVKTLTTSTGIYSASSERLGGEYLVEDSAIVALESTYAGSTDKKNYSMIAKDSFVDTIGYGATLVVDENREVVFGTVENFVVLPAYDSEPIYVTGFADVSIDDTPRTKVFGLVGGKEVEYVLAEDCDVVEMGKSSNSSWTTTTALDTLSKLPLKTGDVLQFTLNGAEEINSYRPLVKIDGSNNAKFLAVVGQADMKNPVYDGHAATTTVSTKLYSYPIGKQSSFVLSSSNVFVENTVSGGSAVTTYDGFGAVGYVNRVNGNNVGLFANVTGTSAPSLSTPATDTELANLKTWLDDNYVDVAGDSDVCMYVTGDNYADGYTVKYADYLKTFTSQGDISKSDDLYFVFKYDGEVILQYAIDTLGNNK